MKTKNATKNTKARRIETVKRIVIDAMLIALFFVLNMVAIKAGNIRITFASMSVILCAVLYGPADACIVAACGEFLNQMLSYGLSPTLPLWILPPVFRGLIIGFASFLLFKKGKYIEKNPVFMYTACILGALVTTAANTLVIYIDSVLYGYYSFAYVFGDAVIRIISSVVTAAVLATVVMPVAMALRRAGIGKKFISPKNEI